jgi:glycosyltransferase involved in cell wall biosynthesis
MARLAFLHGKSARQLAVVAARPAAGFARTMKILLVNNQWKLGGAETVVGQLRRGLASRGCDVGVTVAHGKTYPRDVTSLYPRLLSRLHHTRANKLVEKLWPRFAWTDAAFRALARSDADVIHLHNFHGNYARIASLAHVAACKPLVWTFHALWGVTGGCDHPRDCHRHLDECGACPQIGWWPVGPVDRTAEQLAEKMERLAPLRLHVVAPSRWLADAVRNSKVGRCWRVHHIPNGVDASRFQPGKRDAERVTVLVVNRDFADGQKGFSIARRALELMPEKNFRIVLAGANSAQAAAQLPHGIEIEDCGYVSNPAELARLYSAADIFLFASPAENFPCVVLEAMASGCCVVATPSGGVVEQIEHECSGLLASEISGEALAAQLRRALEDAELRPQLGRAARVHVVQKFSEERMIDAHLRLYRDVTR